MQLDRHHSSSTSIDTVSSASVIASANICSTRCTSGVAASCVLIRVGIPSILSLICLPVANAFCLTFSTRMSSPLSSASLRSSNSVSLWTLIFRASVRSTVSVRWSLRLATYAATLSIVYLPRSVLTNISSLTSAGTLFFAIPNIVLTCFSDNVSTLASIIFYHT